MIYIYIIYIYIYIYILIRTCKVLSSEGINVFVRSCVRAFVRISGAPQKHMILARLSNISKNHYRKNHAVSGNPIKNSILVNLREFVLTPVILAPGACRPQGPTRPPCCISVALPALCTESSTKPHFAVIYNDFGTFCRKMATHFQQNQEGAPKEPTGCPRIPPGSPRVSPGSPQGPLRVPQGRPRFPPKSHWGSAIYTKLPINRPSGRYLY